MNGSLYPATVIKISGSEVICLQIFEGSEAVVLRDLADVKYPENLFLNDSKVANAHCRPVSDLFARVAHALEIELLEYLLDFAFLTRVLH